MPDGRLAISITHADGRVTRLGPDEVDAANIPQGLSFTTQMPGGFGTCSLQLLVRIDLETPLELFDDVTVYGPGGETVWEGRITQLPRSHGDSFGITPGAVGWSAHLKDDPSFTEVYVDRDPSAWQPPSLARRKFLADASFQQGKVQAGSTTGGLEWVVPNESIPDETVDELFYRMPAGRGIAKFWYAGTRTGAFTGFEAPTLHTTTVEDFSSSAGSVALTLNGATNSATPSGTPAQYGVLRTYVTAGPVTPSAHLQAFTQVAVYGEPDLGNHGIAGEPNGVRGNEVIADILSRAAPQLTYTTGMGGSITPATFTIPHLVFKDPVTAEDAVLFVNAYYQWPWAVWEDRTFYWGPDDPDRLCWEARLSEGAHLELEGTAADQTYDGVFVTYTDPNGQTKTVGPPGADADATDASLGDTSSDNPVNSHGIPRKWAPMTISQVTTEQGAIQLGAIWFAEQAIPQRRGSVRVTGTITHPTRGSRPTWAVRAGDYVRISDHPADVPRRILATSYDHNSRTVTMDVGSGEVRKLDAILQRLNVYSIGRY